MALSYSIVLLVVLHFVPHFVLVHASITSLNTGHAQKPKILDHPVSPIHEATRLAATHPNYNERWRASQDVTPTSTKELQALTKLYNEHGGPQWVHNDRWLKGDPCINAWYGVLCDNETGHITTFSVTNNGLTGSIPDELQDLIHLEYLDLSYNLMEGGIRKGLLKPLVNMTHFMVYRMAKMHGNINFADDLPDDLQTFYISSCAWRGSLTASMGRWTKLVTFYVNSNQISGTIPAEFGNWENLENLDFGYNNLYGTLPASLSGWKSIVYFWAYDNKFNGSLPAEFGQLTTMQIFECTHNMFSGRVPDTWANLKSMNSLRLIGNELTGGLDMMCGMEDLYELNVGYNSITGLPHCTNMSNLQIIDIQHNLLQGQIPEEFINSAPNLRTINLSNNKLNGTIPSSFANLNNLLIMDVSHNEFHTTLDNMMLPIARLTTIGIVDLSHNQLYGTIPLSLVYDVDTQEELSGTISSLSLKRNNLTGAIPEYFGFFYGLHEADLSYNNFEGPILDNLEFLSALYLEGNPRMFGTNGALPSFMTIDATIVTRDLSGTFSCPKIVGANKDLFISLDSTYYNNSYCMCEVNYFGTNGTCTRCPEHINCPGNNKRIVETGYFPFPDPEFPDDAIECNTNSFGFTPCNPDLQTPFKCRTGHEGRLCSQCSDGYFARGDQCIKCYSKALRAFILFLFLLAIVGLYTYFMFLPPSPSLSSSARNTAIFYIQLMNLMFSKFSGWPVNFAFLSSIASAFNFGFSFTCSMPDHYVTVYITVILPLLPVAAGGLIFGVLWALKETNLHVFQHLNMKKWFTSVVRTCLMAGNFLYIPVVSSLLSVFPCQYDRFIGKYYLTQVPYLECDSGSSQYRASQGVAAIALIAYGLGYPLLCAYLLRRFKATRREPSVVHSIGVLYVDYRCGAYWFEIVSFARRFVVAVLLTFLPRSHLYVTSTILFLILATYTFLCIRFKPFNFMLGNMIEIMSGVLIAFNLVSVLAVTAGNFGEDKAQVTAVAALMFMMNAAFVGFLLLALVVGVMEQYFPNKLQQLKSARVSAIASPVAGLSSKTEDRHWSMHFRAKTSDNSAPDTPPTQRTLRLIDDGTTTNNLNLPELEASPNLRSASLLVAKDRQSPRD